jgi:hypothetical protein
VKPRDLVTTKLISGFMRLIKPLSFRPRRPTSGSSPAGNGGMYFVTGCSRGLRSLLRTA